MMKAALVVALAATVAFAQVPINTFYATLNGGRCVAQPGFVLSGFTGDTQPFSTPNSFPAEINSLCQIPAGQAAAVQCAQGFVPTGDVNGVVATAPGPAATPNFTDAVVVTDVPAGVDTNYAITTDTSFKCRAVQCNYTCTTQTANGTSGVGCNSSGALAPGQSANVVCNPGFISTSNFTCPADGSTTSTPIVCSNSAAACNGDNFNVCAAAISNGWSMPGACNCEANSVITCPAINANSPMCADCTIPCDIAAGNTNPGLAGRQTLPLLASAAFCPSNVDTIDEYVDCFQQASCAGAINPHADVCVFGGSADCAQGPCPECPSSSKKGLLGLLGLLGLIPLLLCLLLLCLLLCCIRRKKTERDVHFATFDAGAPTTVASAPVVHEHIVHHEHIPVTHDIATVHHQSFVGPEHIHDGPMPGMNPTVF